MNNLRKGALIGMLSGLITVLGLFLNLFEIKVAEETFNLSINGMKSWELIGSKGQEAWGVIFNLYIAFALLTIIFSFLSNKKNLLSILTILVSLGNMGFTFLLYNVGNDQFKKIDDFVSFSFGMGMYLLFGGAILGVVGAILALIKK
jgi:hypothetical protein